MERLSVQEALQRILAGFQPTDVGQIPLAKAAGRVLAQDLIAGQDMPAFDNSGMDGFAVRAADIRSASPDSPVELVVSQDIPAGHQPEQALQPRQAARIMTGAPLPAGADTVIPVEATDQSSRGLNAPLPTSVRILTPGRPGDYVRPRGQDVTAGECLLNVGRRLQPQDLGLLASLGYAQVQVFRKPRVALLTTGDELASPGQPLKPGQIYESNSLVLAALVERFAGEICYQQTAPDQPEIIRQKLDDAAAAHPDLLLTSAGVSVGVFDYVRDIITRNGSLNFWQVNIRPGKPLTFGDYRGIPIIGLPGNPVSSFVTFLVFVVPVLHRLAGLPAPHRRTQQVTLGEPVESDGRESYLRVTLREIDGRMFAFLSGHQGSGNLAALSRSNALLIVPSGVKSLPSGTETQVWLLDD